VNRPRGVVFDLDDTLYRERRFALSGYRAVAVHAAARLGADADTAWRVLVRALRSGDRAVAFQRLCDTMGWPPAVADDLRAVYRAHVPSLRLPATARRVLRALRPAWRIAVLTNGPPGIQQRKVAALDLAPLVDAVVYAEEIVPGGKPAREAFDAAVERLGVPPSRCVVVGDDPERDIAGARRAGLRAVRVAHAPARGWPPAEGGRAEMEGVPLEAVPRVIEEMVA
jgi:putative hydrolase of the HAD superfamily